MAPQRQQRHRTIRAKSLVISIPVPSDPSSLHESLTASEVVMPEPPEGRVGSTQQAGKITADFFPSPSVPATPMMSSPSTDVESVDSLLDELDTTSDEEFWQDSREQEGG